MATPESRPASATRSARVTEAGAADSVEASVSGVPTSRRGQAKRQSGAAEGGGNGARPSPGYARRPHRRIGGTRAGAAEHSVVPTADALSGTIEARERARRRNARTRAAASGVPGSRGISIIGTHSAGRQARQLTLAASARARAGAGEVSAVGFCAGRHRLAFGVGAG